MDERRPLTDGAAARLSEQLIRKATMSALDAAGSRQAPTRIDMFARLIELHRRHAGRCSNEESEYAWSEPPAGRRERRVKSAVQSLPLDQREALLLVALAGFSHVEAAEALGLSLLQFVGRLDKARANLSACLEEPAGAAAEAFEPSLTCGSSSEGPRSGVAVARLYRQ